MMKQWVKRMLSRLREAIGRPAWRRSKTVRWSIGITLTLIIAVLFPSAHTVALAGYSVGSLWTSEDISAPFTFPVYKDGVRYGQDVRKALDGLYPVYLPDSTAGKITVKNLENSWEALNRWLSAAHQDSLPDFQLIDSAKHLGLSKDDWTALVSFAHSKNERQFGHFETDLSDLESYLLKDAANMEAARLITAGSSEEKSVSNSKLFALRQHPNEEIVLSRDSLLTLEAVVNRMFAKLEERSKYDPAILHPLSKIALSSIEPNVAFNDSLTLESRQAIIDRVPRTDGIIIEGQKLIAKGELITPQIHSQLESLSRARLERGGIVAELARFAGTIGHAGLIILLLVLYLKFIRRKIYNDNAQLLLLALVVLFPAILAYISVRIQVDFPFQYFILVPVASMLLTILFDSRTGFYGTVVVSLAVAGIRGNDYSVALAGLCAGAFAAYTVRDLRNRTQLFTSIGYIFIGYLVSIAALSLEDGTPMQEAGYELISSLGNALISPVITLVVLYVFETIFDTVSDLRLSDLDNINHPLLRELALRAPGTYQHTMMVAQLSENAAIAIGANPLLAKVGAYFHDVGKLLEPQTFVENQAQDGNVHESLSPYESAHRVRSHVEQGIALARAHGLPQKVIDFIPMHHGTLPISFFYQLAVMEAAGGGTVNEEEFRYPGPIPNSKETAIVMLADASEAIARTLAQKGEDMSPDAIESSIEQLVRTRFEQHQFDRCDITAHDLTMIRSVFARLLSGLHHPRVPYPALQAEPENPTPALAPA